MNTLICDIEADGLLDKCTKIHCIILKIADKPQWSIYVDANQVDHVRRELKSGWELKWFDRDEVVVFPLETFRRISGETFVFHNGLGYDLAVLEKLLDYDLAACNTTVDTLVMSRYLAPDRGRHGLAYWGERLASQKVAVEDWQDQPISIYLERCIRDVDITERVFNKLSKELAEDAAVLNGFKLAESTYAGMVEQERNGVLFDRKRATALLSKINTDMRVIAIKVEPKFGKTPLPKSKQPTWPARQFKKNGSLTKSALAYGNKIGVTEESRLVFFLMQGIPVILEKQITLADTSAMKDYLFTEFGWRPTIWRKKNITVDSKKHRRTNAAIRTLAAKYAETTWSSIYREHIWDMLGVPRELQTPLKRLTHDNIQRVIAIVIRAGRELPTTPQFQDPVSKTMCPNLKHLQGDVVESILLWMSMRNRRGVLKSWLDHPRLDRDGRIPAESSGLTNTHRQRHKTIVNLPSAAPSVVLGKEMRQLFIAPMGQVCVGYDASGIEARLAGHYAHPYDGGAYSREVLDGDLHAKNAKAYSNAIGRTVSRKASKPITYGIMYGAGAAKVGSMLDIDRARGKILSEAFWDANPGLKACREELSREWYANGEQFIRGIDGRHIPTRSEHSLLNCLIQSGDAIIMDLSWMLLRKRLNDRFRGLWQRVLYMHDEYLLYANSTIAKSVGRLAVQSIRDAGVKFRLNIALDGEAKFGRNYAEVH